MQSTRRKAMIIDQDAIRAIIRKCQVCFVAMSENDLPYVLPFNFGIKDDYIYLHSAKTGRKIDILRKNPRVCVAFSTDEEVRYQNPDVACSYMMRYRSVIAFGTVEFIEDFMEKQEALNVMMRHYTGRDFPYNPPAVNEVETWRVKIESISGKEFGY